MTSFAAKRILCPIDLGPTSGAVLGWARTIAEAFGSKVEVLHAHWFDAPRYFTEAQFALLKSEAARERRMLEDELKATARRVLGDRVPFSVSVVEGYAIEAVFERLKKNPPDLVVMGSHGRTGVARFLLGSVAENVVHYARCPVLIVKGSESGDRQADLRSILCPVDPAVEARRPVEVAAQVAAAFGAELHLLHSVEGDAAKAKPPEQSLCGWMPPDMRSRCHVSETILEGDAARQIVLYAGREKADLVVMGAMHRDSSDFSSLGRTTATVMRRSPVSILLVPYVSGETEANREGADPRSAVKAEP